MCVCVCVCACVRACVRACVCVCGVCAFHLIFSYIVSLKQSFCAARLFPGTRTSVVGLPSLLYYYRSDVREILSSQICPHKFVLTNLSSKFDEFQAARSQFDTDHRVDFYAHTCSQSAIFGPLFAFCCPLFFTEKIMNNAAICHRCDFYAAVFA